MGCGNGKSTEALSPYFKNVIGFDSSDLKDIYTRKPGGLYNIIYRYIDERKFFVLVISKFRYERYHRYRYNDSILISANNLNDIEISINRCTILKSLLENLKVVHFNLYVHNSGLKY